MMNIRKIENSISFPSPAEFTMQEGLVQGAAIGKKDDFLYVVSPKRYKLFADGTNILTVLSGDGFFKWKRGETKFTTGDVFEISQVGEYEVNGNAQFIVKR